MTFNIRFSGIGNNRNAFYRLAYKLAINSGSGQSGSADSYLPLPISVAVAHKRTGELAPGVAVIWSSFGDSIVEASSISDQFGIAHASWSLGGTAGPQFVLATTIGGPTSIFSAYCTPNIANTIVANSTTNQSVPVSTAVLFPPSVLITDRFGNAKSGSIVTFTVVSGSGTISSPTSGSSSLAGTFSLTTWSLGPLAGINTVIATSTGLSGSPIVFNANGVENQSNLPVSISVQSGGNQTGIVVGQLAGPVTYKVTDSGAVGVPGVTVIFELVPSASGASLQSTSSVQTNASGTAVVTPTLGTEARDYTLTGKFADSGGFYISAATLLTTIASSSEKIVMVTEPSSNANSGQLLPGQPIVKVVDAYDNTVLSFTGSISASIFSGNAIIASGSINACVSGTSTYSGTILVDIDSGVNIMKFSSGTLTFTTSSGVTLAPPLPISASWSQSIAGTKAGYILPVFQFKIVDSNGAILTGSSNAATLSVPGANVSGTLTVNAINGIGKFRDIIITPAGQYPFVLSSPGLNGETSSLVTITSTASLEPTGMTEIFRWNPVGSAEPPSTYISGNPANALAYGLSVGKMRIDVGTAGFVSASEFYYKHPVGSPTGVSQGNNIFIKEDLAGNTDGNTVRSWNEMHECFKFRIFGPPGTGVTESLWEILSGTGTAKLGGFWGTNQSGNVACAQQYMMFRALPRSLAPWGPGIYNNQFAIQFISQGNVTQVGSPLGGVDGNQDYNQNFNGFGTDSRTVLVGPDRVYTLELYMKMNDIGQDNGTFRMSIDRTTPGVMVQIMDYTGICRFRDAANPRGYLGRSYSPTLGGGGPGTKTIAGWMAWKDWHISVKGIEV